MAPQAGKCFDGATTLTDINDSVQAIFGNATWVSEFSPVVKDPEKYVAEAALWLIYKLGLCCEIVGQFAMYIGGKVTSYTDLINIYTLYHTQKLSPNCRFITGYPYTGLFA